MKRPRRRANPKTIHAICATSAVLCAIAPWATAQTPHVQEVVLTAQDAVNVALTNNLDIQISRIQPQVDQLSLGALYGAYDPALSTRASHSYFSQPGGIESFDGEVFPIPSTITRDDNYSAGVAGVMPWGLTYNLSGSLDNENALGAPREYQADQPGPGISLDQPLLKNFWIDNTRYTISVAKNTLKTDEEGYRLKVMTVVFNVKNAYYQLISARENVKVDEEAVALKEQTVSDDKQQVQFGNMRGLDEKQAESEAATAKATLQTALGTLRVQQNALKTLLARGLSDLDGFTLIPSEALVAVPEHPQHQECWRTGLEKRPEMIQAKLAIEKRHLTIKYDFNQLFPQLDVVGTYGHNANENTLDATLGDIASGNHPYYSYGVTLTVPLGNRTARYTYRADRAGLQALVLTAKQEEWTIVTEIDNDVENVEAYLQNVDLTREARVYAEQALEAGQTELKLGKTTQFQVLQYQDNLTMARSSEITSLVSYNIALEQLALDEGATLERNHIELRFH